MYLPETAFLLSTADLGCVSLIPINKLTILYENYFLPFFPATWLQINLNKALKLLFIVLFPKVLPFNYLFLFYELIHNYTKQH